MAAAFLLSKTLPSGDINCLTGPLHPLAFCLPKADGGFVPPILIFQPIFTLGLSFNSIS